MDSVVLLITEEGISASVYVTSAEATTILTSSFGMTNLGAIAAYSRMVFNGEKLVTTDFDIFSNTLTVETLKYSVNGFIYTVSVSPII